MRFLGDCTRMSATAAFKAAGLETLSRAAEADADTGAACPCGAVRGTSSDWLRCDRCNVSVSGNVVAHCRCGGTTPPVRVDGGRGATVEWLSCDQCGLDSHTACYPGAKDAPKFLCASCAAGGYRVEFLCNICVHSSRNAANAARHLREKHNGRGRVIANILRIPPTDARTPPKAKRKKPPASASTAKAVLLVDDADGAGTPPVPAKRRASAPGCASNLVVEHTVTVAQGAQRAVLTRGAESRVRVELTDTGGQQVVCELTLRQFADLNSVATEVARHC